MFWKNKKNGMSLREKIITEDDLDDDEFFLADVIDGYDSCSGVNAQRCSSDCFSTVMMPTITVLS
ncbi:hypothetical protein M2454_001432 [Aequitasia blattaphilus]|uniref:Uncharacterized protein n=1 Tax=Aequitasia blattaphilus TaxID=2949332 RepID=A0ABT1ECG6_9FIRM|nr:hypothetical protein [Aequitasia blattaphilus]MCP1103344.1 hypothetical protein [Aequitasia blattaphilus]MCR8615984.1 hypothetical protein [Aequitasia blattaphilus]